MTYIHKCTELFLDVAHEFTDNNSESSFIFGIINGVLAVPTAAANALVIAAILTTSSLRTPSYLLLTSLAFSDVAAGLSQALYSSLVFMIFERKSSAFCYSLLIYYIITNWIQWASLFTITAISVDRYLAIRLKMRYRSVVTLRKVKCIVSVIWIISFLAMASPVMFEAYIPTYGIFNCVFHATCLSIIIICYTRSFRALKIHCAQTQPRGNQQPNSTTQSNAIDVLKYRKLLKTMVLIVVVILVCYLPLVAIFAIISTAPDSYTSQEFGGYIENIDLTVVWNLVCVMYLNSSINPIIYLTRMTDIRLACVRLLRRFIRRK